MPEAVSYRVINGVAWLTIERPEARNALNAAVREGLYAGVRRFNEDGTAKVMVLTGAGEKAFCAGGCSPATRSPPGARTRSGWSTRWSRSQTCARGRSR